MHLCLAAVQLSEISPAPAQPDLVFLHATWGAWKRSFFWDWWKNSSGQSPYKKLNLFIVWATQPKSLNTNWKGGLRRKLSPALMIPPGLDVPYFQAKSLLPPLSALWSPTPICLSSGIFFQLWEERKVNWPDACIASTLKAFPSCPVSYNTDKMSRRPKSTKSNLRAFDHSLFKNHEKRVCWLQLLTVYWVKMAGAKMWPFLRQMTVYKVCAS